MEEPHIVLLRPPRFGKSLLCSMLSSYYDFLEKDSFDMNFGGLDIGRQPTAEASQYYVLCLDLSDLPRGAWDFSDAFDALDGAVNSACALFRERYGLSFVIVANSAQTLENVFIAVGVAARGDPTMYKKLYVIIDEYDRIPNAVMSQENDVLQLYQRAAASDAALARADAKAAGKARASGKNVRALQTSDADTAPADPKDVAQEDGSAGMETSGKSATAFMSPIGRLYTKLKSLSGQRTARNVAALRSFTTGISPMALADASIFNVVTNVTTKPEVSNVLGFSAADVEDAISHATMVPANCRKPLLGLLRGWFSDYRFFVRKMRHRCFTPCSL